MVAKGERHIRINRATRVKFVCFLDEETARVIRARAIRDKTNVSREVRYLLRQALRAEGAELSERVAP